MTRAGNESSGLARRDWLLLPLVVLLTVLLAFGVAEWAAGCVFAERGQFTCGADGKLSYTRERPNCISWMKSAEGPMVEYRFNRCGYRSDRPCGPKPAHSLRAVLMGMSVTMGLYIPVEEIFAERAQRLLEHAFDRPFDVQNMASMARVTAQPDLIPEALSLSPDMIVLAIVPFDVSQLAAEDPPGRVRAGFSIREMAGRIGSQFHSTKVGFAAAHFILQDPESVYRYALSFGPSRDVISDPLSPAGERMYAAFATVIDRMSEGIKGTGIPLVVMVIPNRVTAAMVSNRAAIAGTDGYAFGRRIAEMAVRRGAYCLDTTAAFAAVPHAERLFFPVDNHPTSEGHELLARSLAAYLSGGSFRQFASRNGERTRR